MKRNYFLFFILFFTLSLGNDFGTTAYGQDSSIDSLLNLLKKDSVVSSKHPTALNEKNDRVGLDTNKTNHLIALCNEYRKAGNYANGLKYGNEALQLCADFVNQERKRHNNPDKIWSSDIPLNQAFLSAQKSKASAYNNIGNIHYNQGNYHDALINYNASLYINEKLKNKKDIAGSHLNLGIIYYYLNKYPDALNNYYTALNIRENISDKEGIANTYTNIGLVFDDPETYPEALKNYYAALKIYQELDDKKGIAASYNNIGRIYNSQDNYHEALKMYNASLKINEFTDDKSAIAFSYTNIGNIYWNQVNYPSVEPQSSSQRTNKPIDTKTLLNLALKNYFSALKLCEITGDKEGIIESYINIGNVQMELKKHSIAQDFLNKALLLSKELGTKEWIKESYSRLEELDSIQGNWKASYQHHKLFILYRDSIDTENAEIKSVQDKKNNDFEKKETAVKAEQNKMDDLNEAEAKKQNIINVLAVIVLLLLFMLGRAILKAKRLKKNDH